MSRRWAVVVYDTRAEYGRFRTRRAAERLKAGLCSRTRGVVQMPWTVEVVDLSIDARIGGETKRSSESGNAENGSVPRAPGGAELEAKTAACAWGRMLFDASRRFLLAGARVRGGGYGRRMVTWAHGFVTGWWITTAALLVYIHRQDRAAARTNGTLVIETPGLPDGYVPPSASLRAGYSSGDEEMVVPVVPAGPAPGASSPRCPCGGGWRPSSIDHGACWGTHVDRDGNPALPQPGCRLPDGTYMSGQTPSGSYIGLDGSVLD